VTGANNYLDITFRGCTGLTTLLGLEIPVLPSSVTDASNYLYGTFNTCTGLTTLSGLEIPALPSSVTDASFYLSDTFNSCTRLTTLSGLIIPALPENVTTASSYLNTTFYFCGTGENTAGLSGALYIEPENGLALSRSSTDMFTSAKWDGLKVYVYQNGGQPTISSTTHDDTIYFNPPMLSDGSATRDANEAATVTFKSNETGTYYYKKVTKGASAPTVTSTSYDGTGSVAAANTNVSISLTALSGEVDVYIVVYDGESNPSPSLKVTVGKRPITVPTIEYTSLVYSGAEQTIYTDDSEDWAISGTTNKGTDANDSYKLVLTLTDATNTEWANGGNGEIAWSIKALDISGAALTLNKTTATFRDSGYTILPTVTAVTEDGVTVTDATPVWDPATVENCGTYTVTVTGNGNFTGSANAIYTITQKQITVPTLADSTLAFSGSEQTVIADDNEYWTVTGNTGTAVQSYTAAFTLKDPTNYAWATAFDGEIAWSIEKSPNRTWLIILGCILLVVLLVIVIYFAVKRKKDEPSARKE
jgi:hypothetical protein